MTDSEYPYKSLSNDEIHDILTATLHGPLPTKTMCRIFNTLAEMPELRKEKENKTSDKLIKDCKKLAAEVIRLGGTIKVSEYPWYKKEGN